MTGKYAKQFIDGTDRLYKYAQRLEKRGLDSDMIALAMIHTVAFYAIQRAGPEKAAAWISHNVNIALEECIKKGKMEE